MLGYSWSCPQTSQLYIRFAHTEQWFLLSHGTTLIMSYLVAISHFPISCIAVYIRKLRVLLFSLLAACNVTQHSQHMHSWYQDEGLWPTTLVTQHPDIGSVVGCLNQMQCQRASKVGEGSHKSDGIQNSFGNNVGL